MYDEGVMRHGTPRIDKPGPEERSPPNNCLISPHSYVKLDNGGISILCRCMMCCKVFTCWLEIYKK